MPASAIQVEGLGKRFRIGAAPQKARGAAGALRNAVAAPFAYLRRSLREAPPEEVLWALKDVTFDVPPGQVVGIVGRNGAGKTTLLKILSRITDPSVGRADIFGRVGCLLAVGTGFHPELTGRENIYLNGAIMGMKKAEVTARFEEIVEFAEVAKFIDTPVKYYSSGMFVRLGFSVAAHLEPEILIVDEVLAVGDAAFQRKCLGKMGSVAGEGRTVLLVSHNMEAILGLCSRALLIESGRLSADGPSPEVVAAYTKASMAQADAGTALLDTGREGSGKLRFTGVSLRDKAGNAVESAVCGEPLDIVLSYDTNGVELRHVTAWVWIKSSLNRMLVCFYTLMTGEDFDRVPPEGRLVCRVPRLPVTPGSYLLDLNAFVAGERADRVLDAFKLEITPGDFFGTGRPLTGMGDLLCDHSWRLEA